MPVDSDSLWNLSTFCISTLTGQRLALRSHKENPLNPDTIAKETPRGGVIRPSQLPGYSPANHHGTTNVRLIGPENGARHMEVILGEIVEGGNALPHAHPGLEQAVYVLEGRGVSNIDGIEQEVGAGDVLFFPEGVFHSLKVTSGRILLLVIYAPPYGEDPAKVIR
jgi:quercetin dioxygenase-like cupin family protein